MTKDEALKLALEALERVNTVDDDCDILSPSLAEAVVEAIDFAKEALAQPEHGWTPERIAGMARLKDAQDKKLAQPEQEPVAWKMDVIVVNLVREGINKHRARELAEHFIKHTTTPPQRKPLTDEEINALDYSGTRIEFVRAIEAAHGIKGEA